MKYAVRLTVFSFVIFGLMSYWGIRSPDSEVVFRTTQSLTTEGTFAVSEELEWKGFGLSRGKDGKQYSIFGPGEAIAAIPLYKIAELANSTGWYEEHENLVGISQETHSGLLDFVTGDTPMDLEPHALRTIVSVFNIIVGSLCVFLFFLIIKAFTKSDRTALLSSILFAFGSLIFPYSGTFFSELLETFFVMLSFYLLVYNNVIKTSRNSFVLLAAGVSLGLAAATHITAILFAPFFLAYAVYSAKKQNTKKTLLLDTAIYSTGLGLLLILLAYYNFYRFGDIFETGRGVSDSARALGYGTFVSPWRGLWGLLFGAGKGLLVYCPVIILAIISWPSFHRKYPVLSTILIATALTRLIFIASRTDWHGGFSIGPRYMVPLIPFLMLPIGEYIKEMTGERNFQTFVTFAFFSFLCIAQQLFFSIGEIFSYFHFNVWKGNVIGVNLYADDALYLNWDISPAFYLLNGHSGPLLLNYLGGANYLAWLCTIVAAAVLLFLLYIALFKENVHGKEVKIN
jgi:hypothetical protein